MRRLIYPVIFGVILSSAVCTAAGRDALWREVDTALNKGLPQTAISLLEEIIPEARIQMAHGQMELGQDQEAEAGFRKALQLRADFAEAHTNLGALLKKRVGYAVPVGERKFDHEPIGSDIEAQTASEGK